MPATARWIVQLMFVALSLFALPAEAADQSPGRSRLVSAAWLAEHRGDPALRLIDASPRPMYLKAHIPGAIHADLFALGMGRATQAQLQQRLRDWGLDADHKLVIYDQGASYLAPRVLWDLQHAGLKPEQLHLLDGGMSAWSAAGGASAAGAEPAPPAGSITLGAADDSVRVWLPEFLAATADPEQHVMLEALKPEYFYGGAAFFDRAGHVPHATLLPSEDFFGPDKTFKSPQQIERMLAHLGIRRDQEVLTYCGGGGAAAVPYFALRHLLGYPRVRLFNESQLAWLQDPRHLPVWRYGAPQLLRDAAEVQAWSQPMLTMSGLSRYAIVDVRDRAAYELGHLPHALSLPAARLREHLGDPAALSALLGAAGIDAEQELTLSGEGGLNEPLALAYLALRSAGQRRVSLLLDGIDRWAEQGRELSRDPVRATERRHVARPPAQLWIDAGAPASQLPRVHIASGARPPAAPAQGRLLHLPYRQFLDAEGRPRPAHEIWGLMDKAGLPRDAELVLLADEPGAAAVNHVLLSLMGLPSRMQRPH